jgi:hypothetical protein
MVGMLEERIAAASRQYLRFNTKSQELRRFHSRTVSHAKMSSEGRRVPEGVPLRNVELTSQATIAPPTSAASAKTPATPPTTRCRCRSSSK